MILNRRNHKKTPRAIKVIKKQGMKLFRVRYAIVENALNKVIWARGVKHPPHRIRVKYELKHFKKYNAPMVVASHIPVVNPKGLKDKKIGKHK